MTSETDYHIVLGPLVTHLDRFAQIAAPRLGSAVQPLDSAREFLEYKTYAAIETGNQIRGVLESGTSSVRQVGLGSAVEVTVDRQAKVGLYLLVDTFLFESSSVRDALLQLVNVAFSLNFRPDDLELGKRIAQALQITDTTSTGLEPWIQRPRMAAWLTWLNELRNQTTHRHILQLPERLSWRHDGVAAPSWRAEVGIATAAEGLEPLLDFVTRTERCMTAQLGTSLCHLGRTLEAR